MNWAALSQHTFRLAGGLIIALPAYWSAHQTGVGAFLVPDAEGLSTFVTLIGAIYAVVFAFVIFVIWGQFTEVENATLRECSSLNDLLRFAQHLNPDANRALRRVVSDYTDRVADAEWHSLAQRSRDQATEKAFAVLINAVLRIVPANAAEELIAQRLVDIARKLGEQRDERIAKSLTRIPPTLLALVRIMAFTLLLVMFFYPFRSWIVGVCCFGALGVILFLSNLVMTDTDNPFEGVFNVSSQPFSDLML